MPLVDPPLVQEAMEQQEPERISRRRPRDASVANGPSEQVPGTRDGKRSSRTEAELRHDVELDPRVSGRIEPHEKAMRSVAERAYSPGLMRSEDAGRRAEVLRRDQEVDVAVLPARGV